MKLIDCSEIIDELPAKPVKQFGRGKYECVSGAAAVVARVRQVGFQWVLDGAILCPVNATWTFTSWLLNGEHQNSDFNLGMQL